MPELRHPACVQRCTQPSLSALLLFLLLPLTAAGGEIRPYTGDDAAAFDLPDLLDEQHALSDYGGKVVLVNFWASWCPPCIYEMPELVRLQQRMDKRPFQILALNVGEKKYRVRKFVKLINFELPVLLDTGKDAFSEWGIETLPTSFIVGADGRIRYRVRGDPGWNSDHTLAILEQLLAETIPVRPASPAITINDEKHP